MIKIRNLYKEYDNTVINNINIDINSNKIIGLIGKNGSGKTTLLKIIASLVKPSKGSVKVFDEELSYKSRQIVSFMMDEPILFKGITVKEALEFYKMFFWDFNIGNAKGMLAEFKIDINRRIDTLSKGALEKLNVALIFSRKAKVYLLDEPLGGIDPSDRLKVIDTITNNFEEGSIMIISTNLISEIEHILDEVIFLENGEIKIYSTVEDIKKSGIKSLNELFMEADNEKYS